MKTLTVTLIVAACATLSACGSMNKSSGMAYNQDNLPESVKVPAGNRSEWQTVGVGEITYECRAKADMPGSYAWVFVGPKADLMSRGGAKVGTYYGPPATWEANDGSKLTGTQVAVAPLGAGDIPAQLVKANPAVGAGTLNGVTYIQRTATKGGVAPASTCDASTAGTKSVVKYQADYIFYKAS